MESYRLLVVPVSAWRGRAWSYIKLLRSKSMAIPALFWKNRVCANAMSKAEALREQRESVFKREDLNNVPILRESLYGDIPLVKEN